MAAPASPSVVVLAAGQGTRMRSKTIKLLHEVAGRPMILWVLDAVLALSPRRVVVVVGYQAERVRACLADLPVEFAVQEERRGTGHAVLRAADAVGRKSRGELLILNGDLPLVRAASLKRLLTGHRRSGAALSLLSARLEDPTGYGRVVRGTGGHLERIVEHKDADRATRAVQEINCGVYCGAPRDVFGSLDRLRPDNAQGEYYLTDVAHLLIDAGKRVAAVRHPDAAELAGVNTRAELSAASRAMFLRKADELQAKGVTLVDATRTFIDPRARIGKDTVIDPDVVIEGSCVIGEDCRIRAGVRLRDSRLGRGVEIKDHCLIDGARVGRDASVGPFAHLRPGSTLEQDTKVGNFVELKKTRLGPGSKASHLSYLGDADIGPGCNIGAGTITCNYDGQSKSRTILEGGVFVGSDSQLVAPVRVRKGAYVAAGTTVTEDVPAGSLAIGRNRQRNVRGWVTRRKKA